MTSEQYNQQEAEILKPLPPEFHAMLSYSAYERGHSAGYDECLLHLREMASALVEPVKQYENRLRREYAAQYHEARLWSM